MTISNLQFLVAEDHEFQRNVLVRILGNLGAGTVHEAADGHAALAILQNPELTVDIVISDLDMPGMDGMEFIRRMGQAGSRISLILASALERTLIASVATMTEAYGIKLLGIIEKPLTPGKLLPLIGLHTTPAYRAEHPVGVISTIEEIAAGLGSGQFEPFFQPKIELGTMRLKGAEALARWRHPERGIVTPNAFIQALEDHALIDDLTWLMLRQAARFCRTWRATGLDASVSVNLSLKSLGDTRVADLVTELVRGEDLEPRHIMLEITESAATTDVGAALENLARLRMKGFGLSIDDYGTGYSSMQQLTRIAFNELKIDHAFVTNAARQESARVILESSLNMARKLNITSVAEGVETQADWDLLENLGCDLAQGYFIARPMEQDTFLDWARNWKQVT